MNNKKEKWERSYKLIVDTLKNNELGDAYLILQGLELIGYEYIDFWYKVVDIVKQSNKMETLVEYIDAMQQLGRNKLSYFMNELISKTTDFQDIYNSFISLINEVNFINEDEVIKKELYSSFFLFKYDFLNFNILSTKKHTPNLIYTRFNKRIK